MSLLSEAMTDCVYVNIAIYDDGYGGHNLNPTEGAHIICAIVPNTSIQAKIAQKQGVTELYTVTTQKSVNLRYHDVIKRLEDGAIFRITSNGDDVKTPPSATLDMRQVSAEKWSIEEEIREFEQGTSNS